MKTRILKIFKNLTLMLLMSIILSCASSWTLMSRIIDKFPIGTSEAYFKKNLSSSKRVLENTVNGRTVYRVSVMGWSDHYQCTRFFYFKNGVLVEINEGVRYDRRIKIDKNTN